MVVLVVVESCPSTRCLLSQCTACLLESLTMCKGYADTVAPTEREAQGFVTNCTLPAADKY